MGSVILDCLETSNLIIKDLQVRSRAMTMGVINIPSNIKSLLKGNNKIYVKPLKLPMIVKPKTFTDKSLGGYLCNDVEITDQILIDKVAYLKNSSINDNNIIYDMINNLSSTPFKINKELLDFVVMYGESYGMIVSTDLEHKFENIEKKTNYHKKQIKAHNSKILLQENILEIAYLLEDMPAIYFPVRLDQRGRTYPSPHFLNYQSDDLAKALLLFSDPAVIHRNNTIAIEYLKVYGANCFGHGLDKKSFNKIISWVNDNIHDIINYVNGVLLNKSKNKALFLAFCMEFKRFYEFYSNDILSEFKTYLPVQLDATCNGFQHLALLSNEKKLFGELNLTYEGKKDIDYLPKYFYSYMILKFDNKISDILDNPNSDQKKE